MKKKVFLLCVVWIWMPISDLQLGFENSLLSASLGWKWRANSWPTDPDPIQTWRKSFFRPFIFLFLYSNRQFVSCWIWIVGASLPIPPAQVKTHCKQLWERKDSSQSSSAYSRVCLLISRWSLLQSWARSEKIPWAPVHGCRLRSDCGGVRRLAGIFRACCGAADG